MTGSVPFAITVVPTAPAALSAPRAFNVHRNWTDFTTRVVRFSSSTQLNFAARCFTLLALPRPRITTGVAGLSTCAFSNWSPRPHLPRGSSFMSLK